jgi:adenosylmethionine-8-amino-7-oxononanoate aminotransferase
MEHFGVTPDMMTLGKGITSGYMPLGAVTVHDKVNEPFKKGTYFIHGFTFGGHPLACAAAVATIAAIKEEKLIDRVKARERQLFAFAEKLKRHPSVADVRGWGMMMVLELVADKESGAYFPPEAEAEHKFQSIALKNGLAMYSTLYGPRRRPILSRGLPAWISPAFTISETELDDLMTRFERTLHHWEQAMMAERSSHGR